MGFSISHDTSYYLNLIKELIVKESGLEYYTNKNEELLNKILNHQSQTNFEDLQSYYQFISNPNTGGFDELMNNLTIGETYFFRNKEIFNVLQNKIIPEIIEKKKSERVLRIWSAGCSTGEEVYSILILLNENFKMDLLNWEVKVIGTDINQLFLAKAIKGIYKEWSFRELDNNFKDTYFTRNSSDYKIKDSYRENTFFEYHNLVTDPYPVFFGNLYSFDLIICRNVLIYFNNERSEKIIQKFENCLEEKGYLIIGHSEHNIEKLKDFKSRIFDDVYFYQKRSEQDNQQIDRNFEKNEIVLPIEYEQNIYSANESVSTYKSDISNSHKEIITSENTKIISEWQKNLDEFYDKKNFHKFENDCLNEIQKNKLNPEPYFYVALFKEKQNEFSVAEDYLKKAIYLDRKMILAHYYMALLLQNKNKIKEASIYFKNVMNLLKGKGSEDIFKDFDDISFAQLKKLTEYNLEVLNSL